MFDGLTIGRRGFLGAALAGAAAAAVPAQAAMASPLDARLRERALAALARHRSSVKFVDTIAIADYSRPSRENRFHLIDMASGAVTSMLVAHGRGSDPAHSGWLKRFSNEDGSYASSDGAFLTGAEYVGKHGRSMRLVGLDPTNNKAMSRAIVIHTAPYVTTAMARDMGKIGRSQGCFTVTQADLVQVMARMGPGRFLYSDKV